jgi:hypothetical protein
VPGDPGAQAISGRLSARSNPEAYVRRMSSGDILTPMSRRLQFSLRALLVAASLAGPALIVLPLLDMEGFALMGVLLCGMILLKAADKTRKI